MAFKLRSGNKTSFKNMGSSPLKQDDDLSTPEADKIKKNTRITKEQKLQEEIDYKEAKIAKEQEMLATTPWNEDVKAENVTMKNVKKGPTGDVDPDTGKVTNISGKDASVKTDVGEGGYDYGKEGDLDDASRFDANVNKYKTKTQIKEDKKQRKLQNKLYHSDEGKKLTYAEKYANKTQELADKYQRAKGEGSFGLKFDWKNMLMSDSIAGGFSVERKQDIIADKLSKRSKKRRNYMDKQEGKKQRRNIQIEANTAEINEIDSYKDELQTQLDADPTNKDLQKQIEKLSKQSEKLTKKSEKHRKKRGKIKRKYKIKGRTNVKGETVRKENKGNVDKDYDKRKNGGYKKDK